jgi:hypothetical protein
VLRFERVFDVAIKLLVSACRLRGVQIAAANDVTIWRVKVQGTGDIVKISKWEELEDMSVLVWEMVRLR